MSWTKKGNAVAIVGKYQKDGREKNKYMTCGVLLENEDGHQAVALKCIPFREDGSIANWLSIYRDEDRKETAALPAESVPEQGGDEFSDDIPF